jgi:hypothetical protein
MAKLELLSDDELEQAAGGWGLDLSDYLPSWLSGSNGSTGPYVDDSGQGGCGADGIPSGDGACWYSRDLGPVPQGWGTTPQNGGLGG